jgi:photosystem II stability/assembly factor-like uncharacterized protein
MKQLNIFLILLLFSACSKDNPELPYFSDWTEIKAKAESGAFSDIYFLNDNFGIICGTSGTLLKTTDGGLSWYEEGLETDILLDVAFILDENTFAAGGDHSLFFIKDEANYFKEYSTPKEINGIMMLTNKLWYIHGFDNIFKTTDAGVNWNLIYNSPDFLLRGMVFTSSGTCYAYGGGTASDWIDGEILSSGFLSKTTDGGDNWVELQDSVITTAELMGTYFINNNTGYIANYFGEIYKTTDGGKNWNYIDSTGTWIDNLLFINEDTGYYPRIEKLYKTTDGGENWEIDLDMFSHETFIVKTIDTENYLYLLNGDGSVYKKSID